MLAFLFVKKLSYSLVNINLLKQLRRYILGIYQLALTKQRYEKCLESMLQ
jgi:hypothetical protein